MTDCLVAGLGLLCFLNLMRREVLASLAALYLLSNLYMGREEMT